MDRSAVSQGMLRSLVVDAARRIRPAGAILVVQVIKPVTAACVDVRRGQQLAEISAVSVAGFATPTPIPVVARLEL